MRRKDAAEKNSNLTYTLTWASQATIKITDNNKFYLNFKRIWNHKRACRRYAIPNLVETHLYRCRCGREKFKFNLHLNLGFEVVNAHARRYVPNLVETHIYRSSACRLSRCILQEISKRPYLFTLIFFTRWIYNTIFIILLKPRNIRVYRNFISFEL